MRGCWYLKDYEGVQLVAELFYEKRKRKGLIKADARNFMNTRSSYAAMMVETGAADAMIGGQSRKFADGRTIGCGPHPCGRQGKSKGVKHRAR